MPWDLTKCKWGVPANFDDIEATNAVNNADYTASVYVNISADKGNTKQAFTYYTFGGFRICVVAHAHRDVNGHFTQPGNCYIPGWADWSMPTPPDVVTAIGGLAPSGTFPGDDRYPH